MLLTTPTIIAKLRPLSLSLQLPLLKLELSLTQPIFPVLTLDNPLPSILDNSIQLRSKPEPCLRNLLLHNGNSRLIVTSTNLLIAHRIRPIRHNSAANKAVSIASPYHSAVNGLLGLETLAPSLALLLVSTALNLVGQVRSPRMRVGERVVANELLRDGCVPCSVQIGVGTVERDVNEVAADFKVLDV